MPHSVSCVISVAEMSCRCRGGGDAARTSLRMPNTQCRTPKYPPRRNRSLCPPRLCGEEPWVGWGTVPDLPGGEAGPNLVELCPAGSFRLAGGEKGDPMKSVAATIDTLAAAAGGDVLGDGSVLIDGAAEAAQAGRGKVTYASNEKYLEEAVRAGASCIVVPKGLADARGSDASGQAAAREAGTSFIVVDDPRLSFARILGVLYPKVFPDPGIHSTAVLHPDATLGSDLRVGPYVVVEQGADIGDGCVLASGCYVGSDVVVGPDCCLGPNVVLYEGVRLGSKVNIEAGTVIGSQGFGWAPADGRYAGVPQVGTVVIEDDVDIGANVTIDRATLGETRVGKGTKIDNLVHVAHNVRIGEHCAISGQVGIAGSSVLGDWVVLAGQVGVADHVVIGENVKVGAKSGISSGKIVRGNQIIWGIPARELREAKRQAATLARLSKARERNQSG